MTKPPARQNKNAPQPTDETLSHRLRMRFDWDNLIDELIEKGREQGAFDDLRGHGKPLNLQKNPYAAGMELANELLKQNDLRPAWMMMRSDLLEAIGLLRERIGHTWQRHALAYRFAQDAAQRSALEISWDDACRQWQAEMVKLNKRIGDFNLRRPSDKLEIFKLRLDDELKRAGAARWLD